MAATKALRNALVADLGDINATGVFVTDLTAGEITTAPKRRGSLNLPSAEVTFGAGGGDDEDPETLSGIKGTADQTFSVRLTAASATPEDAIMDLVDDVRNATQRRTGSNICAVSGITVLFVTVSWELEDAEAQNQQQRGVADVNVTIRYTHTRGSV